MPDPLLDTAREQRAVFAPFPPEDTFKLHSRPSATKVIYLDFDGETVTGTPWNGSGGAIIQPAYDTDGDTSSFSTAELSEIQDIWTRVVEDFAPFDVDVTTELPDLEDLRKSGAGDTRWGIRVVIGGDNSVVAPGAGGVAYLGSFNDDIDNPCWVFPDNLGSPKAVAEAASHEVGHTLGLSHDGTSTQGYYPGHGFGPTGWAPIMGVGYYKQLVQWSAGEYTDANNSQDDLGIIVGEKTTPYTPQGNGFTYRPDDYADDLSNAVMLIGDNVQGVIEKNTDVDVFTFYTTGIVDIDVQPAEVSPNLDILATLYDASGAVVSTSNPFNTLDAQLNLSVEAGWYFVEIDGTGKGDPLVDGYSDYGSLGQYTLSATVSPPPPQVMIEQIIPNPRYTGEGITSVAITFDSPVAGFDLGDLTLTRDGMPVPLPSATSPLTTVDGIEWTLSGIFDLTVDTGDYALTLIASGSGIIDAEDGTPIEDDAAIEWSVVVPPPFELNDSTATAWPVDLSAGVASLEAAVGDNRHRRADVDLYSVYLNAGATILIDVDSQSLRIGSRLDSYLRVFDSDRREVASNDDYSGMHDSFIAFSPEVDGTYYIGISAYGNSAYNPAFPASGRAASTEGQYSLTLTYISPSPEPPPPPTEPPAPPTEPPAAAAEPNDSFSSATLVQFVGTTAVLEGFIGDGTYGLADVDMFWIEAVSGSTLTVDVDAQSLVVNSPLDSYLRVFDASGNEIAANDDANGSLDSRISVTLPRTGAYYIGVSAFGNSRYHPQAEGSARAARSSGNYLLGIGLDTAPPSPPPPPPPPPPPVSDTTEPNDASEFAVPLELNGGGGMAEGIVGNGQFGAADVDVYAIQIVAGTELIADIDARTLSAPSPLDSYLRLFDSTGRLVAANDDDGETLDSLLRYTATSDGLYYLGVSAFGNFYYDVSRSGSGRAAPSTGSYALRVSAVSRSAAFSTFTGPSAGDLLTTRVIPLTR